MPQQPAEPGTCPVRMPVRQWRRVDRVLDNVVNVEAENGDPDGLVATGVEILLDGGRQASGRTPETRSPGDWPRDDQEVTVSLTGAQWRFVISCLERWHEVQRGHDASAAAELLLIRDLVVSEAGACLPGQL